MVALERAMTYRLQVRGPMPSTAGSPWGERQYWEMASGTLTGSRIDAQIAMPGGDWYWQGDEYGRPDVRVQFLTDDGAVVLLRYEGLVQVTDAFRRASTSGGETRFEDQYMRMCMFFDTGAEKYAWLTQSLFIAEGRLAGPNQIEYAIYRVL
jgi:Protein of unknown function (DUF3237)